MRNYHKKFTDMLLMHLNTNFILLNLTKQIFGSCFNTWKRKSRFVQRYREGWISYQVLCVSYTDAAELDYIELITFFIKEEFLHKRRSGSRDSLDQVF